MTYGAVFLLIMEWRCIKDVEDGLCTATYFFIQNAVTSCPSSCACRL